MVAPEHGSDRTMTCSNMVSKSTSFMSIDGFAVRLEKNLHNKNKNVSDFCKIEIHMYLHFIHRNILCANGNR